MTRPVHICHCGEHAWVSLTRGHVAFVDAVYADVVGQWNWKAIFDGRNWYAARNHYERINGKKHALTIRMHRIVLPVPNGWLVDHTNRNTLDNRRRNLRAATPAANATNTRPHPNTTSQYRGVSRAGTKWRALITDRGIQKYLGIFDTEEDAARAYDNIAKALHGQFATLNFLDEQVAA